MKKYCPLPFKFNNDIMVTNEIRKQILQGFSKLMDYPGESLQKEAESLEEIITLFFSEPAEDLRKFITYLETTESGRLEEIYSGTFDISPTCFPYVGYLLFGESFKRGEFLSKMIEKFREYNYTVESKELPDHVSVILKFLSTLDPSDQLARELHVDGLLPSFKHLQDSFKKNIEKDQNNPYYYLIRSCNSVLNLMLYGEDEIEIEKKLKESKPPKPPKFPEGAN